MSQPRHSKKAGAPKAEQSVTSKTESKDDAPLLARELKTLEKFESTIKTCLGNFVRIGNALKGINKARLYRDKFKSFDDYCKKQWGMGGKYAYRLIEAHDVYAVLQKDSKIGKDNLPTHESQVRPLIELASERRVNAWKQAVKRAKSSKVTATLVKKVVDEIRGNKARTAKSKPTKQKLVEIAGLVKQALDKNSKPTKEQIKKILEKIQKLLGKK